MNFLVACQFSSSPRFEFQLLEVVRFVSDHISNFLECFVVALLHLSRRVKFEIGGKVQIFPEAYHSYHTRSGTYSVQGILRSWIQSCVLYSAESVNKVKARPARRRRLSGQRHPPDNRFYTLYMTFITLCHIVWILPPGLKGLVDLFLSKVPSLRASPFPSSFSSLWIEFYGE